MAVSSKLCIVKKGGDCRSLDVPGLFVGLAITVLVSLWFRYVCVTVEVANLLTSKVQDC